MVAEDIILKKDSDDEHSDSGAFLMAEDMIWYNLKKDCDDDCGAFLIYNGVTEWHGSPTLACTEHTYNIHSIQHMIQHVIHIIIHTIHIL